jgi:hypothetical protein
MRIQSLTDQYAEELGRLFENVSADLLDALARSRSSGLRTLVRIRLRFTAPVVPGQSKPAQGNIMVEKTV